MVLKKNRIRFHGLRRPKIRADMNKYTLYNLARARKPSTTPRTFFQQKWTAKALSRAYHGEYIREGLWTRMFQRRAPAVVPMDPRNLARQDGREQSAGRGSGLDEAPSDVEDARGMRKRESTKPKRTPYMQMVYHPIERRLDFAVWRALFASSAKQARQMVVHGFVTVNGKKMNHPSYLLNPGDLFQADTTRVMTCLGQRKKYRDKLLANQVAHDAKRSASKRSSSTPAAEGNAQISSSRSSPNETEDQENAEEEEDIDASLLEESTLATTEASTLDSTIEEISDATSSDPSAAAKKTLKSLLTRTKAILDDPRAKKNMSGKLKIEMRAYFKSLRTAMSKASSATPSLLEDLETEFAGLAGRVASSSSSSSSTTPPPPQQNLQEQPTTPSPAPSDDSPDFQQALQSARDNPYDPSLPYATPWRPRDWMSAFAFIPRYLEVNQRICAAVYLRHPVCRPGFAEVPTPFHPETGTLAHCWYLRRR